VRYKFFCDIINLDWQLSI